MEEEHALKLGKNGGVPKVEDVGGDMAVGYSLL